MANAGLGEEVLRLGAIEARVDPRDVLERLIDPDPAGMERRGLSRAVGPDDAQDAPFLDAEIDTVQCDVVAVGLAQAAYFDGGHSLNALPGWRSPAAPRT